MNPYEVGNPDTIDVAPNDEQPEIDQRDEPRLLRLFLTISARIAVYGILGQLRFVAILYWLG